MFRPPEQTLAHQRTQAEKAGFGIDEVVADHGTSGVTTRLADRPQGRRLFDLLRAGDVLVVRWVDRLGRDYRDVCDTIPDLMRRGVVVRTVINHLTFDGATQDPMRQAVRDALIGFMAASAQGHRPRPPGGAAGRDRARQGERRPLPRAQARQRLWWIWCCLGRLFPCEAGSGASAQPVGPRAPLAVRGSASNGATDLILIGSRGLVLGECVVTTMRSALA